MGRAENLFLECYITQLIDDLATIDAQGVGFHSTAFAEAFIAEDTEPEFGGGVLGSTRPQTHPAAKELVRRGVNALPELIKHLSDKRPTQLRVGGTVSAPRSEKEKDSVQKEFRFMFQYFSDEYDPKIRTAREQKPEDLMKSMERSLREKYTIKIGDICYALIGQIVNRRLLPIRYQPTAGLVINSPVETPELVAKVTQDWGNSTKEELLKSLLNDLEKARSYDWGAVPALQRIRFYFPEEYTKLDLWEIRKRFK